VLSPNLGLAVPEDGALVRLCWNEADMTITQTAHSTS
jgi:hypothetical protein